MSFFIKDSVKQLENYVVSQDQSVIKLNQNESAYDVPNGLKEEIIHRLERQNWNRYCENRPDGLISAIAAYRNFPEQGILAGNGSNEMIQTVISGTCREGDRIVVVSPGFSVYPRLAKIWNIDTISVPLRDDFSFDVPIIIEKAQNARMVILASPNNPTGSVLQPDEISKILESIPGIFVLDEAYFEFHGDTAQDLIEKNERLIILGTFSKAFSLAGLRLGYLLAQPAVAQQLEKAKLPFSVGIFQQIAGEILLKNRDQLQPVIDEIIEQRDWLFGQVSQRETVSAVASAANFFLFRLSGFDGAGLFKEFYKRGILLRHFRDERISDFLRVSIGTPKENKKFLQILDEIRAT